MRQFKLWLCSLLLLIANVANSQTSESTIPDVEELTDGIRAFTCEGADEEFPAIFINDNSKWAMVDNTDFDLITEINNGFKIQSSKFPDMLAYFQDTGSYWEYNELSEDGPSKTICREEDEFLEQVTMAIAPKIMNNANKLIEEIEATELVLAATQLALADEKKRSETLYQQLAETKVTLSELNTDYNTLLKSLSNSSASPAKVIIQKILSANPTERTKIAEDTPLFDATGETKKCVQKLIYQPSKFTDQCFSLTLGFLVSAAN